MGLLTKEVEMKWNPRNYKYFIEKGYQFTKWKDTFLVKIEDLKYGSQAKVDVECDCCSKEIKNISWQNYLKYIHKDKKYYCRKCGTELFARNKTRKTKLNNSKSFEQWCIENNRRDVLDRWDYELNDCKPSEICYSTHKKIYFKCPRGLHKSELKNLNHFTKGQEGSINCITCNSFAQWGIDNLGEDFLEKYWDWDKNNELDINPWKISYACKNKIYIKCQNKIHHESYLIICSSFSLQENRCHYCTNRYGKVHPLDSLGTLYPKSLKVWSNKNKKSPYEYSPWSSQLVWWKCPEGKHEDYRRIISNSNTYDFRCPECQYSKGEEVISNYFINKGLIKISQEEFNQLNNEDNDNENYYIPQKEFEGLIGLGGGLLSYDFYLPKLNLLIEYQGRQHERYLPGLHETYDDFLKQLEHDRLKKEYTEKNNIKLLEIWYWDFDNIEEILINKLKNLEE